MELDSFRPQRHSIRLKGYDYTRIGAYFVTVCAQDRGCLFGEVVDGVVRLNDAGHMIQMIWDELPRHYLGVDTDAFVVMPNHIHGIIFLTKSVGAGPRACPGEKGQPQGVAPTLSVSDVVHRFKSLTTHRYHEGVLVNRWPPYRGKLWQRNYYEHVIRNDDELDHIREYIANNPAQWHLDSDNPINPHNDADATKELLKVLSQSKNISKQKR